MNKQNIPKALQFELAVKELLADHMAKGNFTVVDAVGAMEMVKRTENIEWDDWQGDSFRANLFELCIDVGPSQQDKLGVLTLCQIDIANQFLNNQPRV